MIKQQPVTDWQEALFNQVPKEEWLPVADLLETLKNEKVKGHQRGISTMKATKIAKSFNPKAVGLLTVSRRADGTMWLINGQHRAYAMSMLAIPLALCSVYEGLSLREEAELWVKLNTQTAPMRLDLYHGRLLEGDPVAVEIDRAVHLCGFKIARYFGKRTPDTIAAVSALEYIFSQGGVAALTDVLLTVRKLWPNNVLATSDDVLRGVHVFLLVFSNELKRERLYSQLGKIPLETLIQNAVYLKGVYSRKERTMIAYAFLQAYNKGLSDGRKLDPNKIGTFLHGGGGVKRAVALRRIH